VPDPDALCCRIATSLLYGEDDERRQALAAEDPASVPWIKASLDRLGDEVASLATDQAAAPDAAGPRLDFRPQPTLLAFRNAAATADGCW
jgi:hypothetical protein